MLKLRDKHTDPEIPQSHSKRVQLFLEHDLVNDVYPKHCWQTLKRAEVTMNEVIYARVSWEGPERLEGHTWLSRWVPGELAGPWRPMEEESFGGAEEGFRRSF